ncbi:hypothetical protein AVEN_203527-1 [Araneus ventricosus]|uniref:Uncharacterized protein n=1 Tax=Araneus ventricosus TaxID=182803 RepID=A0A4Y2LM52_ARAVE|nr:hypothetical protein AVEN_203527-1 [Araneus ventricosus]
MVRTIPGPTISLQNSSPHQRWAIWPDGFRKHQAHLHGGSSVKSGFDTGTPSGLEPYQQSAAAPNRIVQLLAQVGEVSFVGHFKGVTGGGFLLMVKNFCCYHILRTYPECLFRKERNTSEKNHKKVVLAPI